MSVEFARVCVFHQLRPAADQPSKTRNSYGRGAGGGAASCAAPHRGIGIASFFRNPFFGRAREDDALARADLVEPGTGEHACLCGAELRSRVP